jgi:predicted GIY-YIG superfamily endonuclease
MSDIHRVYVLQNPKGSLYIGFSENVQLRVEQHNAGMSRSTCNKGPWSLVWKSEPLDVKDARKLELDLKRQKGGNGFFQKTGLGRE